MQRSLQIITEDSVDAVLEIIAQNSLYRGNEFKPMLSEFKKLQTEYNNLEDSEKVCFCWMNSGNSALSRIKNSAIGTLLTDLSEGIELDIAVARFEKVVAPTNYKRPTALVTPSMIQAAKDTLLELGCLESIERRFAQATDIPVDNMLFVDRSTELKDVFQELADQTLVNPKTLSKTDEISVKDFIDKVLPTSKSIEVLVENRHFSNFVAILTAKNPESPILFKWDNPFSWAYTGGITDSIKEKVKNAGGKIDGVLRASLEWYNHDDLDIHCIEPDNNKIYFLNKRSNTTCRRDKQLKAF